MKHIDQDVQIHTHPVYPHQSSFVRGINFIPEESMMEVRLKNDDHGEIPYFYPDTSESLYSAFVNADTYGKFYSSHVKSNNGETRDYRATDSAQLREEMEDALEETTQEIVTNVRDNDPAMFDEHRDLFECVDRRRSDRSVMYVNENSDILRLTFEFRRLIVTEALDMIKSKYPSNPEWVQDCQEVADRCADTSTNYMTLTKL